MYTMSNIKNLSLKTLSADKIKITPEQSTTFQKQTYVKMIFIHNGTATLTFKNSSAPVRKNQIILINPNVDYYWDLEDQSAIEITEIGIQGLEFSEVNDSEAEFSHYIHNEADVENEPFISALTDEIANKKLGYEEVAKRYVEIILIHLLRNERFSIRNSLNKKNHKEIQIVKNFMKINYHKNITLDDLVELVHINKFYLIRIFKQEVGMSPIDYLIHIRIDEAQKMLRNTNIAIADIAHLVGFQSPSHFSKTFRELSNMTPSQYRRQGNIPPTPPQNY